MKKRWKTVCVSLGVSIVIHYFLCHIYQPTVDEFFIELEKCPACYGKSLCERIVNPGTNVILNSYKFNVIKVLNVRNVFFGEMDSRKVVFKKLAQDWELSKIDGLICNAQQKIIDTRHTAAEEDHGEGPCHVGEALLHLLNFSEGNVTSFIEKQPEIFDLSDAVICPSVRIFETLFDKFRLLEQGEDDILRGLFVTLLAVNPEPLILTAFSENEPSFADYLGACGRVAAFSYNGVPLTDVQDRPWLDRASYALQLLQLTTRLSSGPIKLYLADPRPDNFVVDEEGKVWVVDAENIILVDSLTEGLSPVEQENDGLGCIDCLSFIPEDLCSHSAADHNYFAVCKSLLSETPFQKDIPGGLLHDAPLWVTTEFPFISLLVEICSYPANSPYRQLTKTHLALPSPLEQEQFLRNLHIYHSETEFVKNPEGNLSDGCTEGAGSSSPETVKTRCDLPRNFSVESNFESMGRREAAKHLQNVLQTILFRHS